MRPIGAPTEGCSDKTRGQFPGAVRHAMESSPGDTRLLGLTEQEAAARLAKDGPNVLPSGEQRSVLQLLLGVAREPMVLLLLASASVYVVLGDPHEALTLLGSVMLVIAITVVQEGRTERALSALRDLSSPRAQVLRDGQARTVPSR